MFLELIKKIFKKKEYKMDQQSQNTNNKRKHKLEIQVYEADWTDADKNNGQPKWRVVRSDPALDGGRPNIIEVADKKEFDEIQQQYAMCEQRIKVVREIDPFVDEPKKTSSIPQNNQAIPAIVQQNAPQQVLQNNSSQVMQPTQQTPQQQTPQNIVVQQVAIPAVKQKPKIVTIGDIEVKYDGDKVYQKQWMKLTPAEAANFRVVNDSNNKIVSLNGKHIEAKRWTLVEDHSDDSSLDDAVESILNA